MVDWAKSLIFSLWLTVLAGPGAAYGQFGAKMPVYGAPSNFEAREAFNRTASDMVLAGREGLPVSLEEMRASEVALDLSLQACAWSQQPRINPLEHGLPDNWGYFCRIDVVALDEPSFETVGFFIYDGLQWRYFGRIRQSAVDFNTVIADFDVVRQQPLVNSPYFDKGGNSYAYRNGYEVYANPYGTNDALYNKQIDDARASPGEVELNFYERFNNPALMRLDEAIERPKGSRY